MEIGSTRQEEDVEKDGHELSWKTWLLASRPKTWVAACLPVGVSLALVHGLGEEVRWGLAGFTLLSALMIQIATNFFNDAIDGELGTDTKERLGPKRAAAGGLASALQLKVAGVVALVVAFNLGLPLVAEGGWPVVVIGVASMILAYGYTGKPIALAYRGLGEIFVLIFFGWVAVLGTVYLQVGEWRLEALLLGTQMGLLSCVLIAINNARDIEEDRAAHKRTLAVRFGPKMIKRVIALCLLGPALLGIFWWSLGYSFAALAPLSALMLVPVIAKIVAGEPSELYNRALALSALHMLIFTFLLIVGFYADHALRVP